MFKTIILFCSTVIFVNCSSGPQVPEKERDLITIGAEQFDRYLPRIAGKRIGLTVNHTSTIGGTHLVDTLLQLGVDITAVYTPEHGFKGNVQAGEHIESQESTYDFRIESLYGKSKKPSAEQLTGVEVMLFDIQDVGVRFYTYISTMHYVMEACAENDFPVIILDRPNPHGSYYDGPVLDTAFRSFVGMHPIPVVHGMTVGELATMINEEGWLLNGISCDLEVVQVGNWTHETPYPLPVRPSPNLPNDVAVSLYPSLCFFEGTIVSIGRGTDYPFQVYGHPKLQGDFKFTPRSVEAAKKPKLMGELCSGVTLADQDPEYTFTLKYVLDAYAQLKGEEFFKSYFNTLAGNDQLIKKIKDGWSEEQIRESWQPELQKFGELRRKYLLYD